MPNESQDKLDREMTLPARSTSRPEVLVLVSPSPLVGCVIVGRDGNVAGEGFYTFDGVTHAEIRALHKPANMHAAGRHTCHSNHTITTAKHRRVPTHSLKPVSHGWFVRSKIRTRSFPDVVSSRCEKLASRS